MGDYRITLKIYVKTYGKSKARGIAEGLREHIFDTFNDDESIQSVYIESVEAES